MDVRFATQAKSDQLNAVDIQGGDIVIKIREVRAFSSDQLIGIYFDGDNGKPWKPSKGMIRVLEKAWGYESDNWIGRSAKIYCDPTVKWAGKEVGGIRVRALSDIPKSGIETIIVHNRQQRSVVKIEHLEVSGRPQYPVEQFEKAFPVMVAKMEDGSMTLQAIFAQLQKTGDLTAEQIKRLEQAAPIEYDENEESI